MKLLPLQRRRFLQETFACFPALLVACKQAERAPLAPAPNPTPAAAPPLKQAGSKEEPRAPAPTPRVYLAPLGEHLPKEDVAYIAQAIGVFYRLEVTMLAPRALPEHAYYVPRARYRAEKLLDFLKAHAPEDSHVIVGLTGVDISTTKGSHEDWGILGLASVGGGECVVSRFRAQRGANDELHTRIRLAKTVVHEVGHTLGLDHCLHHGCLMEDGKGTVTTTDHEVDLCATCRTTLGPYVVPQGDAQIPWLT